MKLYVLYIAMKEELKATGNISGTIWSSGRKKESSSQKKENCGHKEQIIKIKCS